MSAFDLRLMTQYKTNKTRTGTGDATEAALLEPGLVPL